MGITKHNYIGASIFESEVDGGGSDPGQGIKAICSQCGQVESARGTGERSKRCALAKLRENCPRGEKNFYVDSTL